ncbi:MAG: TonB family protein [Desulfurivibrionaceae bacterium]
MNESIFPPEIHRPNWLPPLILAMALHLLLLMAVFYAPGFPSFRHEVKEVVHLVNILDQVEPEKAEIAIPPRPAPPKQPARQPAQVANPARPRPETITSPRPDRTNPPPAVSEQPQPASEYSVYGQDTNPPPARQLGEKSAGATVQGSSGATAGKAGPASLFPGGAGAEERETTRKRYLAGIMAHIEGYKFYPPAARRRKMEGTVQVRFTLEAGGLISGLQVSESEPILEQAAREAVERSLPLPAPKGAASTPLQISYRMNFQLR